jgi:hypothetical protein
MSLPAELHPDFEAQLEIIDDDPQAAATSGMFRIDSLEKANWAISKIAKRRAELAEQIAFANAERERLDHWVAEMERVCKQRTEFLEGELRRYHEDRLADEGIDLADIDEDAWRKAKGKTLKLPAGELRARRSPARVEVDDETFVPWAEHNATDLIRSNPVPCKPAIKQVAKPTEDGHAVDAATGEILPGVTWVEGDIRFSVEPGVVA